MFFLNDNVNISFDDFFFHNSLDNLRNLDDGLDDSRNRNYFFNNFLYLMNDWNLHYFIDYFFNFDWDLFDSIDNGFDFDNFFFFKFDYLWFFDDDWIFIDKNFGDDFLDYFLLD